MLVMIEFSHFSAVNNNIIAYNAQINIQIWSNARYIIYIILKTIYTVLNIR